MLTAGLLLAGCQKINPNFIGPGGETESGTGPGDGTVTTSVGDTDPTGAMTTDGDSTGLPPGCDPTLDALKAGLFAEKCTNDGCHAGDTPGANLNLETADLFVDLLDTPSNICTGWTRVVAQQPQLSMLYARVTGISTCDVEDPVEHELLPADEAACLAAWIDSIDDCERCGGSECIDLQTHNGHCGMCRQACPTGVECVDGACDCPGGTEPCGESCVDTQQDPFHCGGCGNDCGGGQCITAVCDCAVDELNCGACVDPMEDDDHCGGCDQPCGLGETCQVGLCDCSDVPVSFAAQIQPIFTGNCVANNCHGGPNPKKGMDLSDGVAHSNIVDVLAAECVDGRMRVLPGDPTNSYIMHKVLGINMCAGVQMPQSGGPGGGLVDADLDLLSAWICQGALDN